MYKAPEIIKRKPYQGVGVDIFAVAVSLFIMLFRKMPFEEASVADKDYRLIIRNKENEFWKSVLPNGSQPSDELKLLLDFLFQEKPSLRLSLSEILCNSWLTNADKPTHD